MVPDKGGGGESYLHKASMAPLVLHPCCPLSPTHLLTRLLYPSLLLPYAGKNPGRQEKVKVKGCTWWSTKQARTKRHHPLMEPPLLPPPAPLTIIPHDDLTQLPGYEEEPLLGTHVAQQELVEDESGHLVNTADDTFRTPGPTELFLDLILAATTTRLAQLLEEGLSERPIQLLYFILVFQLIYESWLQVHEGRR